MSVIYRSDVSNDEFIVDRVSYDTTIDDKIVNKNEYIKEYKTMLKILDKQSKNKANYCVDNNGKLIFSPPLTYLRNLRSFKRKIQISRCHQRRFIRPKTKIT